MASTSQEAPKVSEGSSPEQQKTEGKDPQTVPLAALLEERSKRQAAEDRLAKQAEQPPVQKPTEAAPPEVQVLKRLQELEAAESRRSLSRQLGLGEAQTAAVASVIQANPNLNPAEALTLAKLRDEKLFSSQEGSGFDPSMHGSLGPTRGAAIPQPPKDDWKERVEHMKKLAPVDQIQADELRNNMIGGLAAAAMGLSHYKIPIK